MHLVVIIFILINVAFITLMERKILGLIQYRKGPNKVSAFGVLQPIADAAKLFLKEITFPYSRTRGLFFLAPLMGIFFAMVLGTLFPSISGNNLLSLTGILLLVLLGFGSYPLFLTGWSSNRKYGIIGSLRGIAQTISYEIRLALILFTVLAYRNSLTINSLGGLANEGLALLVSPFLVAL